MRLGSPAPRLSSDVARAPFARARERARRRRPHPWSAPSSFALTHNERALKAPLRVDAAEGQLRARGARSALAPRARPARSARRRIAGRSFGQERSPSRSRS